MKFRYTILYVEDVADTMAFYGSAFGFKTRMLHESGDYGELDTGATVLAFSSRRLMRELGKSPAEADPQRPVFEVALETDDVAGAVARAVAAGASSIREPAEMPWARRLPMSRTATAF
jgi:lactoylglutathione lyase